jgi:hypothetical protein
MNIISNWIGKLPRLTKTTWADEQKAKGRVTSYQMFGIECAKGWAKLYEPVIELAALHGVEIFQIKEKFGGLRIYVGNVDYKHTNPAYAKTLDAIIRAVENASYHTCEECGEDGQSGYDLEKQKVRYLAITSGSETSGWIRTLCEPCRKVWDDERREQERALRERMAAKEGV